MALIPQKRTDTISFARLELQIVFRTLFTRIPHLQLAASVNTPPLRHEMVMYGLKSMPITWPNGTEGNND